MTEVWYFDDYKYEVAETERTPVMQDGKVIKWIVTYTVLSQEERKPKR